MSNPSDQQHDDVQNLLKKIQGLLARHRLVENLVHRQDMPRQELVDHLVHKQNLVELQKILNRLHVADIAFILEGLPIEDRLLVWGMVRSEQDGEILLEVSDAVRESLIDVMEDSEIKAAAETLDVDELADLAPDLPAEVMQDVFSALEPEERAQVHAAMSYPEDTVGALMDFDMVTVREDVTIKVVLRYLRRFDELPEHTDKIFVVDRDQHLRGILTLETLLTSQPKTPVSDVMKSKNIISFEPNDDADDAAQAFERYDLISAPVVDSDHRVIGRLTVVDIVDYVREESEYEILSNAGLREGEDIFASVWDSVKNRWGWLAINMGTAILASRVIGAFEDSIAQLVALAALMPIVAGMGGNSGNQTITMIVRAIAMGQVEQSAFNRLLRKELGVAIINGVFWGGLLGVMAWLLYDNFELGLVMTAAMILNLLLAATAGVMIPMLRTRFGRDPALGGSVMITGLTDSGGFLIFLGLATIFLL
ncbi:MAG: magnesium transporter [Pseudomonadota bacterium]|nr:magnesium transporter [Pseudomonadota bacterium]